MRVLILIFFVATIFLLLPEVGFAGNEIGAEKSAAEIYCDVRGLITGNVGTIVGLLIAFAGFYMWLMQDHQNGLMMMLAGVALTAIPGFYIAFMGTYAFFFGGDGNQTITSPPDACD